MRTEISIETIHINGLELSDRQQRELATQIVANLPNYLGRQPMLGRCQLDIEHPNLRDLGQFIAKQVSQRASQASSHKLEADQ